MRQPWGEWLAPIGAILIMLVAMAAGRFTVGTPLIPELITQQGFSLVTPGTIAQCCGKHR